MAIPIADNIAGELAMHASTDRELKTLFKDNGIIFDDDGFRIHGAKVKPNVGLLCMKGAIAGYLSNKGFVIADFKHVGNFEFSGTLVEFGHGVIFSDMETEMRYHGDKNARRTSHLTAWLRMANDAIMTLRGAKEIASMIAQRVKR